MQSAHRKLSARYYLLTSKRNITGIILNGKHQASDQKSSE